MSFSPNHARDDRNVLAVSKEMQFLFFISQIICNLTKLTYKSIEICNNKYFLWLEEKKHKSNGYQPEYFQLRYQISIISRFIMRYIFTIYLLRVININICSIYLFTIYARFQ